MRTIWPTMTAAALLTASVQVFALNNAGSPLPPIETVLQRVTEKVTQEDENNQAFRDHYFFTRTRVTEYRNSQGEVKKREEKKRDYDPLQRARTAKPPAPTAKPLTTGGTKADEAVSETHSNVRGKAFEKNDFPLNGDLLKRFDFTVTGREMLNGRPMLIVDFQPAKKKVPERSIKDQFINKAAGRVWVDEADYALVKADLHLSERVNVVGGLVGAVWKFTFGFLRERTADGLWFTRDENWHLEGRELFIHRTIDYHEERAGVRKSL
jgi:hypothetical protein